MIGKSKKRRTSKRAQNARRPLGRKGSVSRRRKAASRRGEFQEPSEILTI